MTHNHPGGYGWQEGEREQVEREMIERQRKIDADETLQWALNRQAARDAPQQCYTAPSPRRAAAPATSATDVGAAWQRYIRKQVDASERAARKALAVVLVEAERKHEALAGEVATLREQVERLESELRGKRSIRSVPSDGTLIA